MRGRSLQTALGAGTHEFVAVALINLGQNMTRFRIVARESEDADNPFATGWTELAPGQHMARYLSKAYRDHSLRGVFPQVSAGEA